MRYQYSTVVTVLYVNPTSKEERWRSWRKRHQPQQKNPRIDNRSDVNDKRSERKRNKQTKHVSHSQPQVNSPCFFSFSCSLRDECRGFGLMSSTGKRSRRRKRPPARFRRLRIRRAPIPRSFAPTRMVLGQLPSSLFSDYISYYFPPACRALFPILPADCLRTPLLPRFIGLPGFLDVNGIRGSSPSPCTGMR